MVSTKLGKRVTKDTQPPTHKGAAMMKVPGAALDVTIDQNDQEAVPLIATSGGARSRSGKASDVGPRYVPEDWDESLPYGGKVYLARRKRPDTWLCVLLQVVVVGGAFGMIYYAVYHTDHMHYHATKMAAHLGHKEAQATVGHKLLTGKGVEMNHTAAMEWFKLAAEQGHPHASYNLAVGQLQGIHTGLKPGDAHDLIRHAAKHQVPEAVEVLEKVCSRGHCDV